MTTDDLHPDDHSLETYDESRPSPRRFPADKIDQAKDEIGSVLQTINSFFISDDQTGDANTEGEAPRSDLFPSNLSDLTKEVGNPKDCFKEIQEEKKKSEENLERKKSRENWREEAKSASRAPSRGRSRSKGRR